MVVWHLKQIGKMKKLDKWVPCELTGNQKVVILRCHLLLFYATMMSHFSIGLWHVMESGFYTTQWVGEEAPKHFLKPNLHQKRSWSLFGGLLPVWSTTVFWILVKSLHLRSLLSKSIRCTENCNACSWHWSTERAQFFTTMQDHTSHNQLLQKLNELSFEVLFHLPYSPDLSPTDHHFFKHLNNAFQGKRFHN